MKNYDFVITNELITDAKNEEEFIAIFNDKLATLFLLYEKMIIRGCNEFKYAI